MTRRAIPIAMISLRPSLITLGLLATLAGPSSHGLSFASYAANSPASPAFETAPELTRVREVSAGIYRGSQPEEMADMVQLFGMGVRTVYTLVTDQDDIDREQEFARILGMRLVSVPMSPLLTPDDETVNFLLGEIQDPRNQPVYLHCRHGKDRTGLIFGLYRVEVQGWTPEQAFAEMREIGFSRWLVALERYFWKRTRN